MKKIFILLFTISLFSCQEPFHPENQIGTWVPTDENGDFISLPYLSFTKDSIYFWDSYDFLTVRKYELNNNLISIQNQGTAIQKSFQLNNKDTTITFNNKKHIFYESYLCGMNLIRYNLSKIELPTKISSKEIIRYNSGFHLIKKNDTVQVKLNDRLRSYDNIPHFVFNTSPHFDLIGNVIYLGENINLQDLLKAYYYLATVNQLKVVLVTNFNLESNEYNVHIERIDIWNEQLNSYFKEKYESNRFDSNSKKYHVNKFSPKFITIQSKDDFNKLENLKNNVNYIISIVDRLDLKDYFRLKERILEIRKQKKIKIRTEFIEVPPDS